MPEHRPKTKKKLIPPQAKSSKEVMEKENMNMKWSYKAVEMLKQGHTNAHIKQIILENKHGVKTIKSVEAILFEANRILSAEFCTNRKHIESLHVRRYNNMMNKLLTVKAENFNDKQEGLQAEAEALMNLLTVMFQKEKLLQFHTRNFKIEINNDTTVNVNKPKGPRLDINKLTFEEQLELYNLMQKAKVLEDEVIATTDNPEEDQVIEDIVAEVIEEEPNVNKMKTITKGIEDDTRAIVTVNDPVAKLKAALRKKAAEAFQDKNANLDRYEMQHLPKGKTNN